jgi:hypothetical protein
MANEIESTEQEEVGGIPAKKHRKHKVSGKSKGHKAGKKKHGKKHAHKKVAVK